MSGPPKPAPATCYIKIVNTQIQEFAVVPLGLLKTTYILEVTLMEGRFFLD